MYTLGYDVVLFEFTRKAVVLHIVAQQGIGFCGHQSPFSGYQDCGHELTKRNQILPCTLGPYIHHVLRKSINMDEDLLLEDMLACARTVAEN